MYNPAIIRFCMDNVDTKSFFKILPCYGRQSELNLVLRHSVPYFPPNSVTIACRVGELNACEVYYKKIYLYLISFIMRRRG